MTFIPFIKGKRVKPMVGSVKVTTSKAKAIAEKTLRSVTRLRERDWKIRIKEWRDARWFKRWRKDLTDAEIKGIIKGDCWENLCSPDFDYAKSVTIAKQILDLVKVGPPLGDIVISADALGWLDLND